MSEEKRLAELDTRISRMESALQHIPITLFDPDPEDWGWLSKWFRRHPIPIPRPPVPGPDPSPLDLSRLSRVQLELALANINAGLLRLDAQKKAVTAQLEQLQQVS